VRNAPTSLRNAAFMVGTVTGYEAAGETGGLRLVATID
jgi:hypothetical protein